MDNYLDFNVNQHNNNNNNDNGASPGHIDPQQQHQAAAAAASQSANKNNNGTNNTSSNNVPTSTINDQDLLDFSGLDQFLQTNDIADFNSGFGDLNIQQRTGATTNTNTNANANTTNKNTGSYRNNYLTPQIKEESDTEDQQQQQQQHSYQPQSYHQQQQQAAMPTPSSIKPPIGSAVTGTSSSSFSGVRRSLSKAISNSRKNSIIKDELSSSLAKTPRSRKSSIVGTPSSFSGVGSWGNNNGGSYMGGNSSSQTTTVERKRRDNINDKIQELLSIIPDDFFYEHDKSTGTKDGKPNKGQILTKSVEYIQFLQNEIDFKNRKEVEYIYKLKKLNYDTSNFSTSAEIGLGKIGVGPLAHLQREEAKEAWLQQKSNSTSSQKTATETTNTNTNDDDNDHDNDVNRGDDDDKTGTTPNTTNNNNPTNDFLNF